MPRRTRDKKRVFENSDELSIEEEDHNAWAVSYGDMISVLLVFFILLISFSKININQFENVKKSLNNEKNKTSVEKLKKKIQDVIEKNNLQDFLNISKNELGVDVNIQDEVLFAKGSGEISFQNQKILSEIINNFKELPQEFNFEIEGHTDDIPIRNERYPSNWYLSTDRGLSVLNIFLNKGFDKKRLKVQGLADTNPIKPLRDKNGNPIEENRKLNRRVLIKVR